MTTLAYLFIATIVALMFYQAFPGLRILPREYRVAASVVVGLAWFPVALVGVFLVLWEALKP